jgi:molybdate transport system substrate-binding protein
LRSSRRRPSGAPRRLVTLTLAAAACGAGDGSAASGSSRDVQLAAAASLTPVLDSLTLAFTTASGVSVRVSPGATGQLYTQIVHGAPYHVFMAADDLRPRQLEDGGHTVPGTRFTYATGRLVLYAPGWTPLPEPPWPLLARPGVRLAIANARTAPYGAAALEVLERLGLSGAVGHGLVRGESVGQTLQFVRSGAAEAGFLALGQVVSEPANAYRVVPDELHPGLPQDAVLLRRGEDHAGARAFLDFLAGDEAGRILARFGYEPGSVGAAPR